MRRAEGKGNKFTAVTPSASYSLTLRVRYENKVGMLGRVTSAIGAGGGDIGAVDIVQVSKGQITRDVTVNARDSRHGEEIVEAVKGVAGVTVINVSDRTFLMHLGGKIEVVSRVPLKTRDDLSMIYTPGVARVSMAIHEDPRKAFTLTSKRNLVAIVTDGSAVLGLGDIGPEAALPVMEGKAILFKEFGRVDAFPICLACRRTEDIVRAVKDIAPTFGGINLEDISAPRCFEIEDRLSEELEIPVFHDDQHGTAVVVLAALTNALKIVGKRMGELRAVISGAGAAGTACAKILLTAGLKDITVFDTSGPLYAGREENMTGMKTWLAEQTNPRGLRGTLEEGLEGADFFLGVSRPGVLSAEALKGMAKEAVVFALANPVPEVMPEEAAPYVRVMATGRSDYPNQINNALCFPGLFRGVLDSRAVRINDRMKLAAAGALAAVVRPSELQEDYIVPSIFDRKVAPAIAGAVAKEAQLSGAARRIPRTL
jgi:malate dehydrogenase (oxaloacetate-decarboxylating)